MVLGTYMVGIWSMVTNKYNQWYNIYYMLFLSYRKAQNVFTNIRIARYYMKI